MTRPSARRPSGHNLVQPCLFAFLLPMACATVHANADDVQRPNIVLIMADDMGFECVSANGSTSYHTPRIDRLAAEGMRFVHAHSQPICTPSRVQLMTGIYNERNYLRFGLLDPQSTTFGHILQKAGYVTCVAGKWQLDGGSQAPKHFGFDEHCLWQLTRRPGRYANPGLEVNGQEIDYAKGEYGPDLVSDFICDFIRRKRDESFFVYYPMILPHWPFEPTPDSSDWNPRSKGVLRGHGQLKYFRDMVQYTDKMVGKVVDEIDRQGLAANTLIIFTGDNGTYRRIRSQMGEITIQGGKGKTTDNGTHVPLVVRWPARVQPGQVSTALVDFSDLLPTLAESAEAKCPSSLDGASFLPVLEGKQNTVRDWIYCWYERDGRQDLATQHIRNRQFKLYLDGRFFDVVADPDEGNDLSTSDLPAPQQAVRQQLDAALQTVVASSRQTDAVRRQRGAGDIR